MTEIACSRWLLYGSMSSPNYIINVKDIVILSITENGLTEIIIKNYNMPFFSILSIDEIVKLEGTSKFVTIYIDKLKKHISYEQYKEMS